MTKAKLSSNFYKLNTEWVYKGKAKAYILQGGSTYRYKIKNINSQKSTSMKTLGKINTTEVERQLSEFRILFEEKGISIHLLILK